MIVIGNKYGKLLVVEDSTKRNSSGEIKWTCLCDCGNIRQVTTSNLRSGNTKSCGCVEGCLKHGMARGSGSSPEYVSYRSMLARCYYKKSPSYRNYGGRGIIVCDRWLGEDGFINFYNDMGNRPSLKHSLDRYPNNDSGIYEKENCRWATKIEQENNRRNNRLIEYNGEIKTLKQWTRLLNAPWATISGMLKRKTFAEAYKYYYLKNNLNGNTSST